MTDKNILRELRYIRLILYETYAASCQGFEPISEEIFEEQLDDMEKDDK